MSEDDMLRGFKNFGVLETPGSQEQGERKAHPLFEELSQVDRKFNDYIDSLGWSARPEQFNEKAKETVQEYIDAIRKHRETVTAEVLLDPANAFAGRIDPVFIPLVRSMLGAEIITPEVWSKFRQAWCSSDLPYDLEDALRTSNDATFVQRFNHARLDPYGNMKLRALQEMWTLEKLVDERRKWKGEVTQQAESPVLSYTPIQTIL